MGEGYIPLYKTFRQNEGGKPGEERTENRLVRQSRSLISFVNLVDQSCT
jgi:hypothetical protein